MKMKPGEFVDKFREILECTNYNSWDQSIKVINESDFCAFVDAQKLIDAGWLSKGPDAWSLTDDGIVYMNSIFNQGEWICVSLANLDDKRMFVMVTDSDALAHFLLGV